MLYYFPVRTLRPASSYEWWDKHEHTLFLVVVIIMTRNVNNPEHSALIHLKQTKWWYYIFHYIFIKY